MLFLITLSLANVDYIHISYHYNVLFTILLLFVYLFIYLFNYINLTNINIYRFQKVNLYNSITCNNVNGKLNNYLAIIPMERELEVELE